MSFIFDSHFHIINPKYSLIENRGFFPKPFLYEDYKKYIEALNIKGGVVVSGSYHGFDYTYLEASLLKLGKNYVGVIQLPLDTPDEEIIQLNKIGVRGIRYNIYNGFKGDPNELLGFAKKVYEIAGWHVDLHIQSSDLERHKDLFKQFPELVIDHLGYENSGFNTLLWFVDKGAKVKASGFGRINLDIRNALKSIYAVNPEALFFGTDLPSTRSKRPFQIEDIHLIEDELGEEGAKKVLYENGAKWYLGEDKYNINT